MMSLASNPLTIALAAVSAIFILSVLLPEDAWERFVAWAWYTDSQEPTTERRMPWERDRG